MATDWEAIGGVVVLVLTGAWGAWQRRQVGKLQKERIDTSASGGVVLNLTEDEKKLVEKKVQERTDFHDLRNVGNAILGKLDLVKDIIERNDDAAVEAIKDLKSDIKEDLRRIERKIDVFIAAKFRNNK